MDNSNLAIENSIIPDPTKSIIDDSLGILNIILNKFSITYNNRISFRER